MIDDEDADDGANWEWTNFTTGEPSRRVREAVASTLAASVPQPTTDSVRALEERLGRDRLVSELTGRTASKSGRVISGDKGAWTRARKWLSDHLGSGRRSKISEPYLSRLAKLITPKTIRVSMDIHGRVSNKDKHLLIRDLDLDPGDTDSYLSGARSRDPGQSLFTVLSVWGNGMENRVTKVYGVNKVVVKPR